MKTLWKIISLVALATLLLLWRLQFSNGSQSGPEPTSSSSRGGQENSSGASVHAEPDRRNPRRVKSDDKEGETIRQLDKLAAINASLVSRFNLRLFDGDINPNMTDWELLGIEKEDADALAGELKEVFNEIRNEEFSSFEVLEQSKNRVIISIPQLSADAASAYRSRIELSFSKLLGSGLAPVFSKNFITGNLSHAGGLIGRDRVVTITPTAEDVFERTKRRYEIRTQVLFEGASVRNLGGNIDNYAQDNGIELVEKIPSAWSHLIAN